MAVRRRDFGISTSEYVLLFSLIIVVAIPSVMFLGDTVRLGFSDILTSEKEGVKELNSLLTPERWNKNGSPPIASGLPDSSGPDGNTTSMLSSDGSFMLTSGSSTTSAEGTTQLVSDMLDQIATSGTLLDGTVLTSNQQSALKELAKELNSLAKEQGQFIDKPNPGEKWKSVAKKNNNSVDILTDEVADAFSSDPSGYQQVEQLMSLVTHGSQQLQANGGGGDSLDVIGDLSPNITDQEIPGFTEAASTALSTGNY